jgi:peptidoglycan/LPS O-acetylase OafA/YrhL
VTDAIDRALHSSAAVTDAVPVRSCAVPEGEAARPRNAALDGVRGVAIAAVLLYHGDVKWAVGGYLGVDMFFVLSGYLITALLLEELDRNRRLDLVGFWDRRLRRLLPAVLLLLLGVAAYARWVARPGDIDAIRRDAFATLFYVQNWHIAFPTIGHIASTGNFSPLQHTWSLAVEEQWYVVWPPLLWWLYRRARGRRSPIIGISLALMVASAAWMIALHLVGRDVHAYVGTDARAQALLCGAILALIGVSAVHRAVPRWLLEGAGVLATVVLAVMVVRLAFHGSGFYDGGATVAALATVVLIAAVISPQSPFLARIFGTRPLAWLGRISYGAYLYHWPIYLVLLPPRVNWQFWPLFALRVGVTLAVATLSFVFVERPIGARAVRRGAALTGDRTRIRRDFAVAAIMVALVAGALLAATHNLAAPA